MAEFLRFCSSTDRAATDFPTEIALEEANLRPLPELSDFTLVLAGHRQEATTFEALRSDLFSRHR